MPQPPLPETIPCPDFWTYSPEWQKKFNEERGTDYLSDICKHSGASFYIPNYVTEGGEQAIAKLKAQNLVIRRLAEGVVNVGEISSRDVERTGVRTWRELEFRREEIFETYNVHFAPDEILKAFVEIKALNDAGRAHCEALMSYIDAEKERISSETIASERPPWMDDFRPSPARAALEAVRNSRKWERIDIHQAKVENGFIYLLANALMPSVYKIGFTAGSPDKRASDISAQYRLPAPFEVVEYWRTKDPYIVEQRIHNALAAHRKPGEFFEVDMSLAKQTIEGFVIRE